MAPRTSDAGHLHNTFNRRGFEERVWDVTVDGVAMDVGIWTERGSLPSRMQATGGKSDYRNITVNGHPGREFVSANVTIIAFDRGNDTIACVSPDVLHTTVTVAGLLILCAATDPPAEERTSSEANSLVAAPLPCKPRSVRSPLTTQEIG